MIKEIKGFEGLYTIDEFGCVYSLSTHKYRKPYKTKTSDYLVIDLWKENKRYKKSIHRLVAKTFLPNLDNKPVVDHIDNNIYNNCLSNLQWVTQRENIYKSYKTMSQVRNYRKCDLYKDGVSLEHCKSIKECGRIGKEKYGLSESMLCKHLNHKGYYIIKCND